MTIGEFGLNVVWCKASLDASKGCPYLFLAITLQCNKQSTLLFEMRWIALYHLSSQRIHVLHCIVCKAITSNLKIKQQTLTTNLTSFSVPWNSSTKQQMDTDRNDYTLVITWTHSSSKPRSFLPLTPTRKKSLSVAGNEIEILIAWLID